MLLACKGLLEYARRNFLGHNVWIQELPNYESILQGNIGDNAVIGAEA